MSFSTKQNLTFQVKVPATSANMGPGFDVMGLAFQIYNTFTCRLLLPDEENKITIEYNGLAKTTADQPLEKMVPLGDNNLFWRGFYLVFQKLDLGNLAFESISHNGIPKIHLHIEAEIPLTRGLGSSSTVILAGVVLANAFAKELYQKEFTQQQLLDFAIEIEGHPDNLAPAMLGGWVIAIEQPVRNSIQESSSLNILTSKVNLQKKFLIKQMQLQAPIRFAGVIPHQSLSTEKARRVLPHAYSRQDVIFQAGNASLYTYLMAQKNWSDEDAQIFSAATADILHEPYRQELIEGMKETFSYWKQLGCLGTYLSGAGTTLMGIWHRKIEVEEFNLQKIMQQKNLSSTAIFLDIDKTGLTLKKIY